MSKNNEEKPAPLPERILVGDRIKLAEGHRHAYTQAYGVHLADMRWTVRRMDKIGGRHRFYVDEVPTSIWKKDATLAYGAQSKERREHLASMGVSV